MLTWVLVCVGGAAGTALGLFLLRRPSPQRLLVSTAAICALMGAVATQPYWAKLTLFLNFGVLGSAASMVAIGAAPPVWLDRSAILPRIWAVIKRLAVYCAVAVTFALFGYLAVRGGITLYGKLS